MERLKRKVEQLKLQVEPAPTAQREADQSDPSRLLALRLFHNAVRERVKPNYSFPGTFPPTLKARVRVVVGRDGTQRSAELIESSGNARFDTLVCLAAIRRSRLPPLPDAVEGDTLTLTLTCSP
jgi:TonB family protein